MIACPVCSASQATGNGILRKKGHSTACQHQRRRDDGSSSGSNSTCIVKRDLPLSRRRGLWG